MAKILSNTGIQTGRPVEAHHVSQSVNALTAAEAYDISISGSLTVNGIVYPIVDGVSGSVLQTDGAGTATFVENNAVSASYITSSRVFGPFGFDSIQTASYAFTASTADFATDASSSLVSIRALSSDTATSASYALTASHVESTNSIKFSFINQTVIPVAHGLGSESIVVQVYEEVGAADPVMIIPDDVTVNSLDQVTVTLATPTSGYVVISGGGFLRSGSVAFAQSASYVAATQRTLTNGSGILPFSFNGSSDAVVAIDPSSSLVLTASYAITAAYAENAGGNSFTASYISSSNVDGPLGMDSVQSASYALTASHIDLVKTRRFNYGPTTIVNVPHNFDSENVFIQVYRTDTGATLKMQPSAIEIIDRNTAQVRFSSNTTGFIIAGQSGFIQPGLVDSASYALTASYALNADIDTGSFVITSSITDFTQSFTKGDGSIYVNLLPTQSDAITASYVSSSNVDGPLGMNSILSASFALTASHVDQIFTIRQNYGPTTVVDVPHNLDTENVVVQVYEDLAGQTFKIIPDGIEVRDRNVVRVTFATNTSGYIVITKGGLVQSGTIQTAETASYINNTYKQNVTGGTVYAITHNLSEEFPIVQAYESTTRAQEIPASVVSGGPQSVVVTFATIFNGTIIVKK